jgi:hypothetical protein
MERQAIEIPRPVRELLDPGELAGRVPRVNGRIGEVLLGPGKV